MDFLFLGLGLLAVVISRLGHIPTESVILWKLNLVATEYGHWFAISSVAFLVLSLAFGYRRRWRIAGALSFLLAAYFFTEPVRELNALGPEVNRALVETFGTVPAVPPNWLSVWHVGVNARPARTLTFAPARDLRAFVTEVGKPAPWVLVIHGGGWDSGDADQLPELNSVLGENGIAAFSINYRLAPEAKWPAPRDDAALAVKYIRAHAAELNVDPERFAVLGRSAGGQIAEWFAYDPQTPAPRGLIAFYAPADMAFAYRFGREDDILNSRALIRAYLGDDVASYPAASPIELVRADVPPTLMFHGPRDPLVWVRQSERLEARLKDVGAKSLLVLIPWATHGFDYNLNGPGGRLSTFAILNFLKRVFA